MKTFILFLIYLVSFAAFYLIISCFGLFFTDYANIITSVGWFTLYTLFIGSWSSALVAREYYMTNESYFLRIGL